VLQVISGAVANFNTGTFTIGAVGSGFTKLLLGNGTWNEGILTATQAALTINSPVDVTGGGGITIAGANTVTLAATALYTGATNINQGTLQFAATTGDIASSSGISLNGGTLNINRTNGITIAQNITGTATTGGLIQNATGGTTILSGTNTYSAPTTITAGTLQFKGAGGLSPNTAISMAGTTLQIRNDGVGNNGNITLGNSVQVTATGATIDVASNGTGTGNTIAFGALAAPVGATVNTINFTGANNYNVSFSSLSLNGGAGQATTLNPTTTSVIITGNVTNPMSGFATTNFDTLTLDGTSTGNAINGKILDNVAGAFTTTLLGGYTKVLKQNTVELVLCDHFLEGAFVPAENKIILCSNSLMRKKDFDNAMKRMLIKMYDQARSENYKCDNCKHLACTEVRAALFHTQCNPKERNRMQVIK
jgi:autotransporter-associated beta strand protein